MTTKNIKKQAAAAPKAIKAGKDDGKQLMTLGLPATAKEGDVYIIVPEGVFGKERWFKKGQMKNIEVGANGITLTLTRAEIASRGLLDHAKVAA